MSKDEDSKLDAFGGAVVTALATFAGALIVQAYPDGVGLLTAGTGLAQLVGSLAFDSLTRRGEDFVSTFRRTLYESHEGDFDEEVREWAKDPNFRNVAYHALRQVRDALDDAVVPALAVLTRDYTVPKILKADGFFRGFGDMLRDSSAEDYANLGALMQALEGADDGKTKECTVCLDQVDANNMAIVGDNAAAGGFDVRLQTPPGADEIARALERNGMVRRAVDNSGGMFLYGDRQQLWNPIFRADMQTIRKIQSVLKRAVGA